MSLRVKCVSKAADKIFYGAGDSYILRPGIDVKYYSLGEEKLEKDGFP